MVKIILEEVKCPLCQETMILGSSKGWNEIRIKGTVQTYDCICEKCDVKLSLTTHKMLKQTLIANIE